MTALALILAGIAGLLHVLFFKLESLDWRKPRTWKTFGLASQEDADTTASLAYNQGFYNLFLAIGTFVGIAYVAVSDDHDTIGWTLIVFACGSMTVSPVERPVASAAYGFVRFIGGGLAPFAAGKLVEHFNVHVPFAIGAITVLVAIAVLASGRQLLAEADRSLAGHDDVSGEVADEFGGASGAIDEVVRTH